MRVDHVEPAVAPPPGNPRFPLFDGLRAIAAFSVLLYHTSATAGAHSQSAAGTVLARLNIGVVIFFVISGFLLYRPFVAARMDARPGPGAAAYARRRFLRIVPAYWVALTILGIYPGARGLWSDDWPIFYGFGQVYSQDTLTEGIGPAWTLCTEVAFYVLLPVYAYAVARALGKRAGAVRLELMLLGGLALVSVGVQTIVSGGPGFGTLGLTLVGTFAWFAVGMALAVLSAAAARGSVRAPAVPALGAWAGALGLFLVLCYVLGDPKEAVFLERRTYGEAFFAFVMSGLIAALLVLPAVFGGREEGAPRRLLAVAPVAWLGLISYGIYLWHEPITRWLLARHVVETFDFAPLVAMTVLTVAITVPIAAASYYLVERQALRFKEGVPAGLLSRRRRRAGPAAAPAAADARGESSGPGPP
jgi:peptidoglycan/LPS O-acetylase OafA/YrhL